MEAKHIIPKTIGWRKEDYDGYNDYYVDNHKMKTKQIYDKELE